jgi:energy-coupling factor transport system permease protein
MIISIILRFVPTLLQEAKKIMLSQAARGVDFSNGSIKNKIKSMTSLIVPMFAIAFQKSDDLANAMIARGYNLKYDTTQYRKFNFTI